MIKTDKYLIDQKFRPSPLPVEGLPLGLRAVGRYRVPRGHLSPLRYSTYTVMAWCINGELNVTIDDMGTFRLSKNHIMVITPGLHFSIEVISDECEFRYIAIDGSKSSDIVLAAGLWTGVFPSREPQISRLEDIEILIESERQDDQVAAISIAHELFLFQAELARELIKDDIVYQAQWYFQRNWQDYEVNVDSAVKYLKVDRAMLSKRFKTKMGFSMLDYLTSIRLCYAKRLLCQTRIPVSEIALKCGYRDPSYFSRIFRIKIGSTPLQYRLKNDNSRKRNSFYKEYSLPRC